MSLEFRRLINLVESQLLLEFIGDAWWYDTKTKKRVHVPPNTEHIDDLMRHPEKYGLERSQVLNTNRIDLHVHAMAKLGWVKVRVYDAASGSRDAAIDTPDLKLARLAVKDLMTLDEPPTRIMISATPDPNDIMSKRPFRSGFLTGDEAIDRFIKHGAAKAEAAS